MRKVLGIFLITIISVSILFGQTYETSRTDLTNEMLSPTGKDSALANSENFEVFKILPRGMFDGENNALSLRGGGAYYSFTNKSHSYNEIPQLELQSNNFVVGFYGGNYGLMADLGKISLSEVNENTAEIVPLVNYQAKQIEAEARTEFRTLHKGLQLDGVTYKKQLPAVPGNTYILRAISFDEADTLVAFQIHRRYKDGSLVIFWKKLKDYEKPTLIKDSADSEK